LLHLAPTTVADKHMLPDLLHGEERKVWGESAYQGQGEAIRKGGAAGARYDQSASAVQGLCGRDTKSEESGKGTSARQG